MAEKLLNVEEAASFLRLSVKEVKELVDEGKIAAFHLDGKYLRFRREDLAYFQSSSPRSQREEPLEVYTFRDGFHDFFYFNDFYLLSLLVVFAILWWLLRG
ncbi:MAG: helix-turn-helix domain-containing protein [Candidatus Omnitrophica bacterium]|nr:helix-turn-helix domain-containing protein [Candidatus Omnitrophota bacterium]